MPFPSIREEKKGGPVVMFVSIVFDRSAKVECAERHQGLGEDLEYAPRVLDIIVLIFVQPRVKVPNVPRWIFTAPGPSRSM